MSDRMVEDILGNITKIEMGQSPDSKYYNTNSLGLPLIQGNADIKERKSINRIWTTQITKECDEGDILMTVRAPVGKIGIASYHSCIGRGVCAIKAVNVDLNYLYYLLLSKEDSWQIYEQGSTFTAVGSKEIFNFPLIVVASIPEQTHIANILKTCDIVIEKTKVAISKYNSIKQGMLQDLFTRGIDIRTGKLRPRYKDMPELYKESKLGKIPLEWESKKIKDSIYPIMSNVDKIIKEDETKILLCNYMDVYVNRYLSKDISFTYGSVNTTEMKRFILYIQDVIITKDSETPDDIAVPAVLIDKIENLVCGYHLCILRSKDLNLLNGEFLMLQLQLYEINKQFSIRANGSTRYGLTIDAIENCFIKIPNDINEQIEIVKIIKTIDNKIKSEQNYLQKLQAIKQGLMSDLLTGKKKVRV